MKVLVKEVLPYMQRAAKMHAGLLGRHRAST